VASVRRSVAPEPDLSVLLPSWELHLRAERKSPQTVKTYGDGVRRYLGYCTDQVLSTLDRTSLASFIASLLDAGAEPATGRQKVAADSYVAGSFGDLELVIERHWEGAAAGDLRASQTVVRAIEGQLRLAELLSTLADQHAACERCAKAEKSSRRKSEEFAFPVSVL
jgi:hypothetical protein